MSIRRGKYWEPNPDRQVRAVQKRVSRQMRNMRNAVRQGTHKRIVHSGTRENPCFWSIVPR